MAGTSDFHAGDAVELQPGSGYRENGARFGTVKRVGRLVVIVALDGLGVLAALRPQWIKLVQGH